MPISNSKDESHDIPLVLIADNQKHFLISQKFSIKGKKWPQKVYCRATKAKNSRSQYNSYLIVKDRPPIW